MVITVYWSINVYCLLSLNIIINIFILSLTYIVIIFIVIIITLLNDVLDTAVKKAVFMIWWIAWCIFRQF